MTDFSSSDDIIDSRAVIARIDELESEIDDLEVEIEELETDVTDREDEISEHESTIVCLDAKENADEIEELENNIEALHSDIESIKDHIRIVRDDLSSLQEELEPISEFAKAAESYAADWLNGATLINESYFEKYAEELAYDIGAIDRDATWPGSCIDWEQAADELKIDYRSIEFEGTEFFVRM